MRIAFSPPPCSGPHAWGTEQSGPYPYPVAAPPPIAPPPQLKQTHPGPRPAPAPHRNAPALVQGPATHLVISEQGQYQPKRHGARNENVCCRHEQPQVFRQFHALWGQAVRPQTVLQRSARGVQDDDDQQERIPMPSCGPVQAEAGCIGREEEGGPAGGGVLLWLSSVLIHPRWGGMKA